MRLSDHHRRLVFALGQTLYTRERAPRIDGADAQVEERFTSWFNHLGAVRQGTLVGALTSFDVAFGVSLGKPGRTFASGDPADRLAFVEQCLEGGPYVVRQAFEAIRFSILGAYGDSPAVHAAIGLSDPVATARARFADGVAE